MAAKVWPRFLASVFLFILSLLPLSVSSELNSPQNIETFFQLRTPPVTSTPSIPKTSPASSPPSILRTSPSCSTSFTTIGKAVGITAAGTLVLAGIFFFFVQKYTSASLGPRLDKRTGSSRVAPMEQNPLPPDEFNRYDGNLKGLIVDDNGLDVLYWRMLQDGHPDISLSTNVLHEHNGEGEEEEEEDVDYYGGPLMISGPVQEIPFLDEKFLNSSSRIFPLGEEEDPQGRRCAAMEKADKASPSNPVELPPSASAPPPPPPPPPPLANPAKKNPPPPPPPPITMKKGPPVPPPLPHSGASLTSLKQSPAANPKDLRAAADSSPGEKGSRHTKLKPLHWDKVTTSVHRSMVWDKLNNGSFSFDGDLMEALFGYAATNRKPPGRKRESSNLGNSNSSSVFILNPHKSQNTAIVLRSLALSRQEILDGLLEGRGLNADTLEKLTKIAPTEEEETQILEYIGDPTKLADAESFLFHTLKAVPSAFTRLDALLFRSNYDHEILQVRKSLQTLESACKELRTRGLFTKLLEAVLKAGNRMNAGTARGDAQAFNLTALRKLSDVKSIDGKTTLLHFVVEEVVRYEGKRCLINRNHNCNRSNSRSNNSTVENTGAKEETEKECIKLGLPAVVGLSVEFSNVKKSARIDYDAFAKLCPALKARMAEIRLFLGRTSMRDRGGFVRGMKGFLEAAEEEVKIVEEEQTRVMELVKRTTRFYWSGALSDEGAPPLQLFEIVKDFLDMVDQACIDISRNQQKTVANAGSSLSAKRIPVRFANLPAHFLSEKSSPRTSSSSDSDGDDS